MAGTPLAGTDGRVVVNGVILNLSKWSVNPQAADIPTTNFESQGYEEGITGIKSCEISADGFWDASEDPHADPPNLVAGEIIGPVTLYISKTLNKFWNFPEVRVLSVPVQNEVEGHVTISASMKSNGPFTYP